MILNKVIMAVVSLSILSAPVAHSAFTDFVKRGFKSCTDNCTASACGDKEKRSWCVKNCSYMKGDSIKIDMNQVCAILDKNPYNPNKPMSDKEKQLMEKSKNTHNGLSVFDPNKPMSSKEKDLFNAMNKI